MDTSNPNMIGAQDAGSHFPELLQRVEAGEEVTIVREGSPVARLIPIRPSLSTASREAAIRAMQKLARDHSLAGLRVKDLLSEGRR